MYAEGQQISPKKRPQGEKKGKASAKDKREKRNNYPEGNGGEMRNPFLEYGQTTGGYHEMRKVITALFRETPKAAQSRYGGREGG